MSITDTQLPSMEDFLEYPEISPATLGQNVEDYGDEEGGEIYLDDILIVRDALDAYVKRARPVVQRLAEERRKRLAEEEQGD